MPTIFTILIILFVVICFLAAVVLIRTSRFGKILPDVEAGLEIEVDVQAAAEHLSGAIRIETISFSEDQPANPSALEGLHEYLEIVYPEVHAHLKREKINEYSLLYTWVGSNPDLDPILLMAHQDVVPADPETLDLWEHAPFDGDIADGFVWGRGSLDIKNQLITIMEAVEALLKKGFQPERTVCMAFGHDEEIGGSRGAAYVARHLEENGVRLAAVIDEGMSVMQGALPGVEIPVALIGTGEKGYLTLKFSVELEAGHASTPPKQTAIGVLSNALARLEDNPMPGHPERMKPLMESVGIAAPFVNRMAFANLWLFRGVLNKMLSKVGTTSASIRTTTAVTMINGGVKDNILPRSARASVNFRLLPGDTIADVCDHVRKVIDDDRVKFEAVQGAAWEASPVSPTDTEFFKELEETTHQVFGAVPVAPFMMLGGTDSRNYVGISDNVFRFSPVLLQNEDIRRVHGLNERISFENLENMIKFFEILIPRWTKA